MAEGLLRHPAGDRFAVYSAGTEATFVRPHAKKVMSEIGIDISGQEPKTLEGCLGQPFDYVIAAFPLGGTRGDASTGAKVGTKGHQRSQEVQYVVPAI